MKKALFVALALGVLLFLARYVHIRTNGIHLSYEQFVEMAGDRDSSGSMHLMAYDGHRDGKVFLRSWEMNRIPRSITYWTELDSIPSDVRIQILNGTGRWILESPPPSKLRNFNGEQDVHGNTH
jgi:hypothetical protein